jgi:hypothetical protein
MGKTNPEKNALETEGQKRMPWEIGGRRTGSERTGSETGDIYG